jgi:hypothetical protein
MANTGAGRPSRNLFHGTMERVPMIRILDLVHSHKLLDRLGSLDTQVENHTRAVALHFTCYNFVRIHWTLRVRRRCKRERQDIVER